MKSAIHTLARTKKTYMGKKWLASAGCSPADLLIYPYENWPVGVQSEVFCIFSGGSLAIVLTHFSNFCFSWWTFSEKQLVSKPVFLSIPRTIPNQQYWRLLRNVQAVTWTMKNKGVTNQLGFFWEMLWCVHYFLEKYRALKFEYLAEVLLLSPGLKKPEVR